MKRLTVLNTRAREQAAELTKLLRAAQFEVAEAPAIAVEPAWDPQELATFRGNLAAYSWVVLPSANAGRLLAADLRSATTPILCGSGTATALHLDAATVLDRFSAAAALDWLRPRVHPRARILVPRAAEGRDELIDGLVALGAIIDAPVAYRTVLVPDAQARLTRGGIDIVALCSPSAVRSLAGALQPPVRVACLGRTTAHAAESLGVRVDAVAQSTSMASLVASIEALTAGAHV